LFFAFRIGEVAVQYTIGQVEIFAFNFAPVGFLACQGQLLPIMQYQALFALIGTQYGGNGATDFALPKLAPVTPKVRSTTSAFRAAASRAGLSQHRPVASTSL
jgi:microcystin-dependent protein